MASRTATTPWLTPILPLLITLAACGGGTSDAGGRNDTRRSTTAGEVAATASGPVPDVTVGGDVPMSALGEPTGLTAGGTPIQATLAGRDCTSPGLFGTCRGAAGLGGAFLVSAENNPDDFSQWTLTVHCATGTTEPVASVTGKQLVAFADLTFAAHGEVIGAYRIAGADSEAMLIFQPSGAACPQIYGLGKIKEGSIMTSGNEAVGITRPDGTLACATAEGPGFVVAENQPGC